jgi:hypothetical protein
MQHRSSATRSPPGTLAHHVSPGKRPLVLHTYHNHVDVGTPSSNVMPTVNGASDPIHAGLQRRSTHARSSYVSIKNLT